MTDLYLLFVAGCEACDEARSHLSSVRTQHPEIGVHEIDLSAEEWPEDQIESPEGVPAYALVRSGSRPRTFQGRPLTAEEIDRWIRSLS